MPFQLFLKVGRGNKPRGTTTFLGEIRNKAPFFRLVTGLDKHKFSALNCKYFLTH